MVYAILNDVIATIFSFHVIRQDWVFSFLMPVEIGTFVQSWFRLKKMVKKLRNVRQSGFENKMCTMLFGW